MTPDHLEAITDAAFLAYQVDTRQPTMLHAARTHAAALHLDPYHDEITAAVLAAGLRWMLVARAAKRALQES